MSYLRKKIREILVRDIVFNQDHFHIIAGPCAIEDYDSLYNTAKFLKDSGLSILRGGSFKMRTSPNSFQGLGLEALKYLKMIGLELNMITVSEITDLRDLDLMMEHIDIILVGTRNMYNYPLLSLLGKTNKPVILKRGMNATIDEWLLAAQYIEQNGNKNIILCERGIRTFETKTRNTLDLSAIPIIHELCDYPIIADPSHATGKSSLVPSMALASLSSGADGLIIEIHPDPKHALSDSMQMLNFQQFTTLLNKINQLVSIID